MSCSHEERTKRLVAIDGLIKHEGFFWGGGVPRFLFEAMIIERVHSIVKETNKLNTPFLVRGCHG